MIDQKKQPVVIKTFMTQQMSDADILAISTGREEEFGRIMGAVKASRSQSPGRMQHVVLYGSRGFGKSFMTRRVQIEIEKTMADENIQFVMLSEEQRNLQMNPHAFLEMIEAKIIDLKEGTSDNFQNSHFQWPVKKAEANKYWNEKAQNLENTLDKLFEDGKGLVVVVVENFDHLLANLFKESQKEQRLRKWLDRDNNRIMIFATATGSVDMDYDRPLFKAFETVRLTPWSNDDCIDYFNRQRDFKGQKPLSDDEEAKARAISTFIGGTPRLAQLLGEVIDTQDALSVAEMMDELADKLAEYYRNRIEDLPPRAIGILDAMIRGGEPVSQTALAERVGAPGQNAIAQVMSDLKRADIVRGMRVPDSKETLYQITDRVFVHYYRLREGNEPNRETPLATILEFLRSFYSKDEKRAQSLLHLKAGRVAEADLFNKLAFEGLERDNSVYRSYFNVRLVSYLNFTDDSFAEKAQKIVDRIEMGPAKVQSEYSGQCDEVHAENSAISAVICARAFVEMGHIGEAIETLKNQIVAHAIDSNAGSIIRIELAYLYNLEKQDSKTALEILADVNESLLEHELRTYFLVAQFSAKLSFGEDIEAFEIGIKVLPLLIEQGADSIASMMLIEALGKFGRNDLGIKLSDQALELTENLEARGFANLAKTKLLIRSNKFSEAAAIAVKMVNNDDLDSFFLFSSYENIFIVAPEVEMFDISDHALKWLDCIPENPSDLPDGLVGRSLFHVIKALIIYREIDTLELLLDKAKPLIKDGKISLASSPNLGRIFARLGNKYSENHSSVMEILEYYRQIFALFPSDASQFAWTISFVMGLIDDCHNHEMLRDVAAVFSESWPDDYKSISSMLNTIADFEEADDKEKFLARLDPATAKFVRTMRDIPEDS